MDGFKQFQQGTFTLQPYGSFFGKFSSEVEKCITWSSTQVLPNQVSKKSFYAFEDINLQGFHAKLRKNRVKLWEQIQFKKVLLLAILTRNISSNFPR